MADLQQSAEQLFGEVLDLEPEQRSAFLDLACRESPELRRRVDELLLQHRQAGDFLLNPVFTAQGASAASTQTMAAGHGLAAGARLGRYTILGPLGAGGMGLVYRAHDEKLEREVAIKTVAPGMFAGNDARQRFRREALALAKLSHPHIATVYDVGEQDGLDYIVMECVPGESLQATLRSGPLPVKEATLILRQIAQALEEAHEQGIIHRDLKPANVMLTPKGQVKILDFGLAKLLVSFTSALTSPALETRGLIGTPLYMSPEQVQEKELDTRTDLWNLGILYYELLTGSAPFQAESSMGILRAITDQPPSPLKTLRPDAPPMAERIVSHALEKDPARRYQAASEVMRDAAELLSDLEKPTAPPGLAQSRAVLVTVTVAILIVAFAGALFFYRASRRRWAHEEAIPRVAALAKENKPLAAFLLLEKAQQYLPQDAQLQQLADESSIQTSILSDPPGAEVEIQDYLTPNAPWHSLGTAPLNHIRIPKGYFRWRVSKAAVGEMVVAPRTAETMSFPLREASQSPPGTVFVRGASFLKFVDFIGWYGAYKLPSFYLDRDEVTNRDYQKFVDSGGYEKKEYWSEPFLKDGRQLPWSEGVAGFRDTSGRPGPSSWVGGHYPEGQADFPVAGVSWFEASAYAAYAGKRLPVLSQWFESAPSEVAAEAAQLSNINTSAFAPVGKYQGLGPYGTYDMIGNVREWVANAGGDTIRFILGGAWNSQSYLSTTPEALSPFDRSPTNGFRCVKDIGSLPQAATAPIQPMARDFSKFKTVSDDVFRAYTLLYAYPHLPLNAKLEGVVADRPDWREEKVSFDAGYGGQRMFAYVFLPKKVRPPYQTILFFPSARVLDLKDSRKLGDLQFFDYIVQSGRAVVYPIYQGTYERQVNFDQVGGHLGRELDIMQYKDAARTLDYLATRPDIDSGRLAYLGVSMGSAKGIVFSTLLQNRLKTAVFLDGGFFLNPPEPGSDGADFASRLKIPVLMVNGRYDYSFSLERAQNPLFAMLATPPADKRHVVLDTPHDVTQRRPELVKAVLNWFDRYLGPVRY